MRLSEILARFPYATKSGNGWQCKCPAHKDKNPSLTISEGAEGRTLFHCHAGCTPDAICAKIGLTLADLFAEKPERNGHSKKIVATYDYLDLNGKLLFQVCREEPKTFKQRRTDGSGGWTWNTRGIEKVLFRLPEILRDVQRGLPIVLAEGEKDCLELVKHGFSATCNPGGAGKWQDSFSETLCGAVCIVIADKDTAGRAHAQLVAGKLFPVAKSVRVIELPDVNGSPVKDASDFFAAGGEGGQIQEIKDTAPEWTPAIKNAEPEETEIVPSKDETEFEFANRLAVSIPPIKTVGSQWYSYQDGTWSKTDRAIYRPMAQAILPEIIRTARREATLLDHLEGRCQVKESDFNGFYKFGQDGEIHVNVSNGVLRIKPDGAVSLIDHSPDYRFTLRVTAAQKPFFVTNVVNGLPVVQFRGLQFMNLSKFPTTLTQAEALIVVEATNWLTTPYNYQTLWMFGNAHYPYYEEYPYYDGSIEENFGSSSPYELGVPSQRLDLYNIYDVMSQTNNWEAWMNQLLLYESTNNTVMFNNPPTLGNSYYGNSFNGNVPEVLVFNRALTGSERTTVNAYLNSKYGLIPSLPPAPTNLAASAISPSQIGLTWNEPLNGGATQIAIERSLSSGGPFTLIAEVPNALSYVDTNLAAGTTYYYQVQAVNVTQLSPPSNLAQATTLASGADIPFGSLALWLKADSGLLQATSNTTVSLWSDQSGNGNNATQPVAVNQPVWTPGAIGSLPAVQFNGSNSYFYLPSFMNTATGGEAFVVLKVSGASGEQALWEMGGYNAGGPGQTAQEAYPFTDGSIRDGFGSASRQNIGIPLQPLTQYHVYEASSQSNNWAAWINGMLQYQTTNNAVSFGISPTLGWALNSTGGGAYRSYFAGDIAEILIFNRPLTVDEKISVGDYLFSKYILSLYATNTSAPAAPTNLVANGTTPYQLNLRWAPAPTNVTGYLVERKLGTGGVYQEVGSTWFPYFSDTSVVSSNQYFYEIKAANYFGQSGNSPEISPPVVSLSVVSSNLYNGGVVVGSSNLIVAQAVDADSSITQAQIICTSPFATTNTFSSFPCTNTWTPQSTLVYFFTGTAADVAGNSWVSVPFGVPVYLSSNTNGIPNYFLVEQGNNPVNPWIPPSGDSNTNPPTINLVVPANATLLP